MGYYVYVILANHIIALIFSILTIKYSVKVLSKKVLLKTSMKHSPVFTVYFVIIFITGIVNLINFFYLIVFWRPDTVIYDARILYIASLISTLFVFLNSTMEAFLCFDRCLTVLLYIRYTSKLKFVFTLATIVCNIFIVAGFAYINKFFERIPNYVETQCTYFACFLNLFPPLYVMTSKIASAGANIVACFILIFLLKMFLKANNTSGKRISKTVCVIILITTIVDFGPTLIGKLIWMVFNVDIAIYIGPYVLTFSFLNTTLCAGIYSKAFQKSAKTSTSNNTQQINTLFKSTHSNKYKNVKTSKNFTNVSTF